MEEGRSLLNLSGGEKVWSDLSGLEPNIAKSRPNSASQI